MNSNLCGSLVTTGLRRLMTVAVALGCGMAGAVAQPTQPKQPAQPAAALQASLDDASLLPTLHLGGTAMRSSYTFWGNNWAWAGQTIKPEAGQGLERRFSGHNEVLPIKLKGSVANPSTQTLRWRWDFTADTALKGSMRGGIEFQFDLTAYRDRMGEPELLSGKRGWAWGRPGRDRVELRFDAPVADIFFEPGQRELVRVLFYKDGIPARPLSHTATLTLEGSGAVRQPASVRYGLDESRNWPLTKLDKADVGIDLSFLNAAHKPAGKLGHVRAQGQRLVWPDGSPALFWGTNVSASALFLTPKQQVPAQARRLSRLGVNLVRMHHHDSPWTSPNIFGSDQQPSTRRIDPAARDALHWWVKCLQDEGIYVWIDLHVQRHFKAADGIEAFEELPLQYGNTTRDLKGFNYVNESIKAAMKSFADEYLGAVNPYTQRRLMDDPGVMAVQITNENDITYHFGNLLLPNKNVPKHNAWYMAASRAFAKAHNLSADQVWRSWEHGPSKLFLNDLERQVHQTTITHLRQQGLKAPISTTSQWGNNPVSSIPSLTIGELIDVHSYSDGEEIERNPRWKPNSVHYVAMSQVPDQPLTLSEWNVSGRHAPDRHTLPLYVAANAAHQGWDSLMHFAYSQIPLSHDGSTEHWSTFNDPAQMVPFAAAALMYRQGHVKEASSIYAYTPNPASLFNKLVSSENSPALRVAAERGKLLIAMPATPQLPWLKPSAVPAGATRITDNATLDLPEAVASITSDSGELMRDWGRGVYTINTPRSQAAMGWIGGSTVALADVEIAVKAAHATVSVHSMDGRAIAQSGDLLIALSSVTVPAAEGDAQFRSQPLGGTLNLRLQPGLQLFELAESGAVATPGALKTSAGRYTIELGNTPGTRWLRLRSPQATR